MSATGRCVHTLLALLVAGAGCSQQAVVLPSRDFDKPVDMTFACIGVFEQADGRLDLAGQPMANCHPPGIIDPVPTGEAELGKPMFRTYAFVPNAARGDLSVINMSYCRDGDVCFPPGAQIIDLDPDSIGYGAAPLGKLPEVITASQDGCRLVTANRGSCDLTFVNPSVLLAPSIVPAGVQRDMAREALGRYARTVVPRTSSGRLAVAPGEIAFLPQQTTGLGARADLCSANPVVEGTLAAPVGAPPASVEAPASWRAVVTFPSCDLVALVDLPSGDILDSFQVDATASGFSFVHSGRDPVCPVSDCGLGAGQGTPVDGSATPDAGDDGGDASSTDANVDGAAATPDDGAVDDATTAATAALVTGSSGASLRVGALAVHPEGNRVYFGAANSSFVGALDITGAADTLAEPTSGSSTALQPGSGGVMRLRLSVDPYAYSKGRDAMDPARAEYGRFVAGRHDIQPTDPLEFLYVVARDGSLRVIDVGRAAPFECDLGIDPSDPRAQPPAGVDFRPACFPYGAVDGPRRFQYAGGPGLRFGSPVQDVAFANYRTPPLDTTASSTINERVLNGAFAFVLTAAGTVPILNIDPELRMLSQIDADLNAVTVPESPAPLTHSQRDANVVTFSSVLAAQNGPPRLDTPPTGPVDGPRLFPFKAFETRINARIIPPPRTTPETTYVYFPNRTNVIPQGWGIVWEGDLTGVRGTGDIVEPIAVKFPMDPPPLETRITDNGNGFCGSAADGDTLTLTGCDVDAACPPGTVCVHSSRVPPLVDGHAITGMCLRRDRLTELRNDEQCRRMLETPRRYEIVGSPTASVSVVVPRRSEVHRPVQIDGDGFLVSCIFNPDPKLNPCRDPIRPTNDEFQCTKVVLRPDGTALGPTDLRWRCLITCTDDTACGLGRACVQYPDGKFCAEAAPIAAGCGLEQLFSYKLSASGAFVVSGSAVGRSETIIKQVGATGPRCAVDPVVPPARIPLNAPVCDPSIATAYAAARAVEDGDPMSGALSRWLAGPSPPTPNPCLLIHQGAMDTIPVISALFENRELRFLLTDLQKTISNTLQIRFEVHGGLAGQMASPSADAQPGLPARILVGPIPQPEQKHTTTGDQLVPGACTTGDCGWFSDLPYMFVVDQRQVVNGRTGLRGQILRITPRLAADAPVAGFESFAGSGRYFPIQ